MPLYDYTSNGGGAELVVGGVFLRLYIANPAWTVRHPRQFATELMEQLLELMPPKRSAAVVAQADTSLGTVTKALVLLFNHHPSTADQIPAQGYLPQFANAMLQAPTESARSALLVLNQMVENEVDR